MGAVDIVFSLFTPETVAIRRGTVDARFLTQVRVGAERQGGISLDEHVGLMDAAGVDVALVPAIKAGDHRWKDSWEIPYDHVAEVVERYPGRLRGVAGVSPSLGQAGLRELERGVRELGFVAAHLYPHWFELPPDHRRYYPIYSKCAELGIPIMMQVGQCLRYGGGRTHPSVGRPITLDTVAIDFPELTIIGIHIGYPWTDEMISMAWKHENVYIGSDAYAPKHWPAAFVQYLNTYGQDKVLFGTDFPVIDPVRAMREIDALDLRPEPRAKFLRGNAERVFRL